MQVPVANVQSIKRNQEILNNMKFGITSHLEGPKKTQFVVAKNIVCMLDFGSSIGSSRNVVKMLGVDKRNIRKTLEQCVKMDIVNNAFWITQKRSRCFNTLLASIRDIVIQFWTSQTMISLNRKDVVRWCIFVKVHEEHATNYLQVSQVKFQCIVTFFFSLHN